LEQFAIICNICSYYGLFTYKLDKFWSNQDIIFDYETELPEIGSKSFINNFD